ncbi:MAG: dihydrodipicolinate synthase family protein [Corallococcus sp.]|nr:dihydrodipicolinate synthase family protein [Corallococcus sp.]MCM1359651.1 dihydrodipicolinate synthase family protein [Corallococcus sp.]MCM1395360.1 dihydrodipicolinate synthase family protein [Corallococcus sp.]
MKRHLITALATPFLGGKLDVNSYLRLLEMQRAAACDVLVAGTTAEGALLTVRERKLLMSLTREYLPDAKMWVGVSSGITKRAMKEAMWAQTMGAYGVMVTPPSFFKCTADGFAEHVRLIKRACNLPVMLYNAPSRCGYQLWKETVLYLAQKGAITCIKDAGADADYAKEIAKKTCLYCGNEEKLAEFAGVGACGVVSVVSNVRPLLVQKVLKCAATVYKAKQAAELAKQLAESEWENDGRGKALAGAEKQANGQYVIPTVLKAKELYAEYQQLVKLAFCEVNPIPIKYMLYKTGIFRSFEMRLPLSAANKNTRQLVDKFLG